MKSKCINFELLYLKDTDTSKKNIYEHLLKYTINDLDHAARAGNNSVVLLMLMDGFLYKNNKCFTNLLQRVKDYADFKKIKLTLMPGMAEHFNTNIDIQFFDFNHWMVYQSYGMPNLEWNSTSDKFLFLGGVPSRFNRISLIYKFYKQKMLRQSVWSFFTPWTADDKKWCRAAIPINDKEYNEFLENVSNSLDSLYTDAKNYSKIDGNEILTTQIYKKSWLQDPCFVDPAAFKDTLFSVISEGNAYSPATNFSFLTEKTWRAVVNKHPFIIAGYTDQVEYAKQRGLKTFNDYFLIKDYHKIKDDDERMEAVVTNTEYFLNNYHNNIDNIRKDIEHNYNVYIKTVNESKKCLEQIEENDVEKYFNKTGFSHLLRIGDGNKWHTVI